MNVRQVQERHKRRVWDCDKDINRFPSVPKHQQTCFLFAAHNVRQQLAYYQERIRYKKHFGMKIKATFDARKFFS